MTESAWHDEEDAPRARAAVPRRRGLLTIGGMLLMLWSVVALARPASVLAGEDGDRLVARLYDEAVEALERGAQIRLPRPVEVVLLTTGEATVRRKAYAAALDEDAGITAGMDMLADLVFSGSMLGRYLPDEKVVYVIEDVLDAHAREGGGDAEDMLFAVLAHELVHAYDDMVHEGLPTPGVIKGLVEEPQKLLELNTTMALVEGRATFASELACRAAGRAPLDMPTEDEVESGRHFDADGSPWGAVAAGMGNSIVRIKLLQYVHGRAFARDAYEFGGERFFDEVFAHLPLSDTELRDFDRFRVRWALALEEGLEDGDEDGDGERSDERGGEDPTPAPDDASSPPDAPGA